MFFLLQTKSDTIQFLGHKISVLVFLALAIGLAILVFLILLAILLIMYLRKRMAIKGYLGFEDPKYNLEDKILHIESEISQIQKKFRFQHQTKKNKFINKKSK